MSTIRKTSRVFIIIAVLAGLIALAYFKILPMLKNDEPAEPEPVVNIEILKEKLVATAEMNTAEFICTSVEEYNSGQKYIGDWKIPFTSKGFTISYEGYVKAGISDLQEAEIEKQDENTIVVILPEVEITEKYLDKDTLEIYDETHNILNQISVSDVNEAQKRIEENMVETAIERGLLETAKENTETIITMMLGSTNGEYEIIIQWQE